MSVMPAGLRYERPASLQAASDLLAREGSVALAGGQSLLAAMKLTERVRSTITCSGEPM